jgi:glycosyltransferase involved in cell wall biosynthesis
LAANVFSAHPYSVTKHYTRRFAERLTRLLSEEHFDLLHCEWTPYASYLPPADGLPKFMMTHNIESQVWFRRAQQGRTVFERTFFSLQGQRMEIFEREAVRRVDAVGAVTPLDAEQLRAWGARRVSLIENGADLDRFKPSEDKAGSGRILFLASLDCYPNQDALDYFLRQIMQLVSQRLPTARLQVVGKGPPLELRKRLAQYAGVELVGEVRDVRPYLAQAAVVVVPLRVGGGSRIKILEALAMGKPVVSTSVGAEGLALSDGVHIALADTPVKFAACTVDLLTSPQDCQRLGEAGRRLVAERYSWDRAAGALDSAWQEVCQPRRNNRTANRH